MQDKDTFLNYHQQIEVDDFTNAYFKRIFNILHDYYSKNDTYQLSSMIQYIDSDDLREALISLDSYVLNEEPFEHELEDYINILNENKNEDSLEVLNHKLREATRIGDIELQKYYLQLIVNKNKSRM